jgi:hypothetical protein
MLHRPTLMSRIKLPPTSPQFPQPALLHAICAYAAAYTAWVTTLPYDKLEAAVIKQLQTDSSLEGIEDFGLAQAEASARCVRSSTQACHFENEGYLLEMIQASVSASYRTQASKSLIVMIDYRRRRVLPKRFTVNRLVACWIRTPLNQDHAPSKQTGVHQSPSPDGKTQEVDHKEYQRSCREGRASCYFVACISHGYWVQLK